MLKCHNICPLEHMTNHYKFLGKQDSYRRHVSMSVCQLFLQSKCSDWEDVIFAQFLRLRLSICVWVPCLLPSRPTLECQLNIEKMLMYWGFFYGIKNQSLTHIWKCDILPTGCWQPWSYQIIFPNKHTHTIMGVFIQTREISRENHSLNFTWKFSLQIV